MEMMDRINTYWSRRADEFSDARRLDLDGPLRGIWTMLIREHLPQKRPLRALDLGTGAGFFAFMLADLGCEVTGIDYSEDMVEHARQNARELGYSGISFLQMDAQQMTFDDGSFDFIFTRNVTWTLPDPARAYTEMCRVLAPGGRLLNGDANYGAQFREADRTGETQRQYRELLESEYQYPATGLSMIRERNDIADKLYISDCRRPQWDVDALLKNGMSRISIDMEAADLVYPEKGGRKVHSDYTNRFFLISATKPER